MNEDYFRAGFVQVSFAGLDLIVNDESGFINATHLCTLKGREDQTLVRYNELEQLGNLIRGLTNVCGEPGVNESEICDPRARGTFFHPTLLLDLAAWLAPITYVGAVVIVDFFFKKTDRRRGLWEALFRGDELITYENDPRVRRIRYENLELLVNELGWFNASDLCRVRGIDVDVDDFKNQENNAALLEYFRIIRQPQDAYYNSLASLRLAAWVDAEFYVHLARFVFGCQDEHLNSLFERQILYVRLSLYEIELARLQAERNREPLAQQLDLRMRVGIVTDIQRNLGFERVGCVVLFLTPNNGVRAIRRQFQTLIQRIHELSDEVVQFVGWFISHNAVIDFLLCKALVREQARDGSCSVSDTYNTIALADGGNMNFDLPAAVRRAMLSDLEIIEADVNILAHLFGKQTYSQYDAPDSCLTREFLAGLYPWFRGEVASFMQRQR